MTERGIKLLLIVASLVLAATLLSCSKSAPSEPVEEDENTVPGRRDYVWEVDTIDMVVNSITNIWGTGPDDLWIVGPGGTDTDRLWHFDGKNWTPYTKTSITDGISLFGFAKDDIWMGSFNGGEIWHYNGSVWSRSFVYEKPEDASSIAVSCIYGLRSDDVYAAGGIFYSYENGDFIAETFILHYDGHSWKEVYKGSRGFQPTRLRVEEGNVYIHADNIPYSGRNYEINSFFKLEGGTLKEIFSYTLGEVIGCMNRMGDRVYFCMNGEIFRWFNNKLVSKISFKELGDYVAFFGRNSKDIFAFNGPRSKLFHYNGQDIKEVSGYPSWMNFFATDEVLFEKDIFITGMIGAKDVVLHGRLKEDIEK